jgi:dTDP-L-rhamnose 4-epimerase
MEKIILITGGAGFIGSHLADLLITKGYKIRIIDQLTNQVHGMAGKLPDYLSKNIEFIHGNLNDQSVLRKALEGVYAVFHFASSVGVGQSMYRIREYTENNCVGTAMLLENIVNHEIHRLIIASSMSIYGEGSYKRKSGQIVNILKRKMKDLHNGIWEPRDENGDFLEAVPTGEDKQADVSSIYALTKYSQEKMALIVGSAYKIPTVALRFFNVYGTRQALSNPYTGVLAIFASRYLNNHSPILFEDGMQKRDFVSVHDVCNACCKALEHPGAIGNVFNIGSGQEITIKDLAVKMGIVLKKGYLEPQISNKYRVGDIRHCFADITKACEIIDYKPSVNLDDGLSELGEWLNKQQAVDSIESAHAELYNRGLAL